MPVGTGIRGSITLVTRPIHRTRDKTLSPKVGPVGIPHTMHLLVVLAGKPWTRRSPSGAWLAIARLVFGTARPKVEERKGKGWRSAFLCASRRFYPSDIRTPNGATRILRRCTAPHPRTHGCQWCLLLQTSPSSLADVSHLLSRLSSPLPRSFFLLFFFFFFLPRFPFCARCGTVPLLSRADVLWG